jgi:hypothetical protein
MIRGRGETVELQQVVRAANDFKQLLKRHLDQRVQAFDGLSSAQQSVMADIILEKMEDVSLLADGSEVGSFCDLSQLNDRLDYEFADADILVRAAGVLVEWRDRHSHSEDPDSAFMSRIQDLAHQLVEYDV